MSSTFERLLKVKVWLIFFLFNIHTGQLSEDATWVKTLDSEQACYVAAVNTGPQKPDKDGNIKIYACQVPPPENNT